MKNKLLAFILTIALIFTTIVTPSNAASVSITDVPSGLNYYNAVEWSPKNEVIYGISASTVSTGTPVYVLAENKASGFELAEINSTSELENKWLCVSKTTNYDENLYRQYNNDGNVLLEKRTDNSGNIIAYVKYSYNYSGRCIRTENLLDKNSYTIYSYNDNGMLSMEEHYTNNTVSFGYTFFYSNDGKLTEIYYLIPKELKTQYQYNASGQISKESNYSNGTLSTYTVYSYTDGYISNKTNYNSSGIKVSEYKYDRFGNETYYYSETDQTKRTAYYNDIGNKRESYYYQFGKLKSKTVYTFLSNGYWYKSVTTDSNGKQTSVSYYTYDEYWNLSEIRTTSNNQTKKTNYEYALLTDDGIWDIRVNGKLSLPSSVIPNGSFEILIPSYGGKKIIIAGYDTNGLFTGVQIEKAEELKTTFIVENDGSLSTIMVFVCDDIFIPQMGVRRIGKKVEDHKA